MAGYKIDELTVFANTEDGAVIDANCDKTGIDTTFKAGQPIYPKPVNYVLRTTSLITKALLNVAASTNTDATSIQPNITETNCNQVVKEGFDSYVIDHINSKIKSEKGTSETDVMSQKAVTNELNGLDTEIANIKNGQTMVESANTSINSTNAQNTDFTNTEWTSMTASEVRFNSGRTYEIAFSISTRLFVFAFSIPSASDFPSITSIFLNDIRLVDNQSELYFKLQKDTNVTWKLESTTAEVISSFRYREIR